MAKNTEEKAMRIKEFIDKYELADEDTVFIHNYNSGKTEEYLIKDIPRKILNQSLYIVQPNYGGKGHKYSCYLLIYRKEK